MKVETLTRVKCGYRINKEAGTKIPKHWRPCRSCRACVAATNPVPVTLVQEA